MRRETDAWSVTSKTVGVKRCGESGAMFIESLLGQPFECGRRLRQSAIEGFLHLEFLKDGGSQFVLFLVRQTRCGLKCAMQSLGHLSHLLHPSSEPSMTQQVTLGHEIGDDCQPVLQVGRDSSGRDELPDLGRVLDRVPYHARDDLSVRLATVPVSRWQRSRRPLFRQPAKRVSYRLAAMLDVTEHLGSRPGRRQARKVAPVRVPRERRRRSPRSELAIQVIVEAFKRVPCNAPWSRPSLDPSLD